MIGWAIMFLIIALIAAIFAFAGIALVSAALAYYMVGWFA